MKITLKRAALMTAFVTLMAPVFGPSVKAAPLLQAERPTQQPDRAQSPDRAQPDRSAQQSATAAGQLVKVDPDAKTLSIKTANGPDMMFRYNDQTVVTGGEKSVAGLATMSGAQVTVSYRTEGANYIATRIEVRDKA
jgi:hypothetical protein